MFKLFPFACFLQEALPENEHWACSTSPPMTFDLSSQIQHFLKQRTFLWRFFFYLYIFLTVFLFYLSFLFDFYFHVSSWAFGVMNLSFWRNHFWKWLWNWVSNFLRNFFIKISSCFTYNIIYNEDKYHSIL